MPLIAAGVGAVANIGSSWLAGKAAKKQAKNATRAAAGQAAANSALAQFTQGQNRDLYAPSAAQGQQAGNVLMEMLLGKSAIGAGGGGGGGTAAAYTPPPPMTTQDKLDQLLPLIGPKRTKKLNRFVGTPEAKLQYALSIADPAEKQQYDTYMMTKSNAAQPSVFEQYGLGKSGTGDGTGGGDSALSAYDQFRNSTNYNWRLNEGARAANMAAAGGPVGGTSGAAAMALNDYGQNMAHQELGTWMQQLAQQQGVGQQSMGQIANSNNNLFSGVTGAWQPAVDAQMNQYGINSQATGNLYGSIASGVGQVAGAYFNPAATKPTGYGGYGASSYPVGLQPGEQIRVTGR